MKKTFCEYCRKNNVRMAPAAYGKCCVSCCEKYGFGIACLTWVKDTPFQKKIDRMHKKIWKKYKGKIPS